GHRCMPMVGRGNRDGVYVLQFKNLPKVFVRRGSLARLALHAVSELSENIAVHIADMRDAGSASVRLERREMSIAAPIQSDHRKVEPIVGTGDPAIAPCRSSDGKP